MRSVEGVAGHEKKFERGDSGEVGALRGALERAKLQAAGYLFQFPITETRSPLANVDRATDAALAVDHLASERGFHAVAKAELADTLDITDTFFVMSGHCWNLHRSSGLGHRDRDRLVPGVALGIGGPKGQH